MIKTILTTIMVVIINSCSIEKQAKPEIYLIPEGYEGSFYVVFDILTGRKPEYEDKFRVYRIPASGVLQSRFSFNEGWLASTDIKYFFINKNGKRTPITHRWLGSLPDTPENRHDPKIYIFSGGVGTLGLGMSNDKNKCTISFSSFIVATKPRILEGIQTVELSSFFNKKPFPCQKNYQAPSDHANKRKHGVLNGSR